MYLKYSDFSFDFYSKPILLTSWKRLKIVHTIYKNVYLRHYKIIVNQ